MGTVFTSFFRNFKINITSVNILAKRLNVQRQRGIEEYYWQLAGETDEDDEITLICAMVDSAVVEKRWQFDA